VGYSMGPLIYLLEDDASLRELLVEVVHEELSVELAACASMSELRALCASRTPDLLVADFWGTSHLTLDDAERSEISALARVAPLVLISARNWAQGAEATELGLAALLLKPLELEGFVEALRTALACTPALGPS
jgi:DNA-binding NtrC family response regulator